MARSGAGHVNTNTGSTVAGTLGTPAIRFLEEVYVKAKMGDQNAAHSVITNYFEHGSTNPGGSQNQAPGGTETQGGTRTGQTGRQRVGGKAPSKAAAPAAAGKAAADVVGETKQKRAAPKPRQRRKAGDAVAVPEAVPVAVTSSSTATVGPSSAPQPQPPPPPPPSHPPSLPHDAVAASASSKQRTASKPKEVAVRQPRSTSLQPTCDIGSESCMSTEEEEDDALSSYSSSSTAVSGNKEDQNSSSREDVFTAAPIPGLAPVPYKEDYEFLNTPHVIDTEKYNYVPMRTGVVRRKARKSDPQLVVVKPRDPLAAVSGGSNSTVNSVGSGSKHTAQERQQPAIVGR